MMKMGIIPDKFILLEQTDDFSEDKIKTSLASEESFIKCKDQSMIGRLATAAIRENNIHMASVRQVC